MMIEIHISSALHHKIPAMGKNPTKDSWELPDGSDIQQVLERLKLAEVPVLLMLNGRQGDRRSTLNHGDVLKIFAVLGGG